MRENYEHIKKKKIRYLAGGRPTYDERYQCPHTSDMNVMEREEMKSAVNVSIKHFRAAEEVG